MPIKAVEDNRAENRPAKVGQKQVQVDEVDLGRSWRRHDADRVKQLCETFGPKHEWGVTLLASVKALEETNPHGFHYVDDGASTCLALCDMKAEWEHDKVKMPDGDEWDAALVEVFIDGLTITIVRYEDSSPEARALHQSQVHCAENNTFRQTSAATIYDVGSHAFAQAGAKREDAIKYIIRFQGKGCRTRAATWVDFACALRDNKYKEVRDKLKDMPGLPPGYVVNNPAFCSFGAKAL